MYTGPRVKVHIIDPDDLDHAVCGRDFRTVQHSVHPLTNPHTFAYFKQMKWVCSDCLRDWRIEPSEPQHIPRG